jgi:DNA-directed RNA polymerase specialized sigma subunit
MEVGEEGGSGLSPVMEELSNDAVSTSLLFDSLTQQQKFVYQHSTGYQGAKKMKGKDIAKEVGISPARVSEIQKQLRQRLMNVSNSLEELGW